MNFKARLKNKTFIVSMATLITTFIYQILALFGVVSAISENEVINFISIIVNLLAGLGVLVDPTTAGIEDSERAMTYYTVNDVREVENESK